MAPKQTNLPFLLIAHCFVYSQISLLEQNTVGDTELQKYFINFCFFFAEIFCLQLFLFSRWKQIIWQGRWTNLHTSDLRGKPLRTTTVSWPSLSFNIMPSYINTEITTLRFKFYFFNFTLKRIRGWEIWIWYNFQFSCSLM